MAALLVTLVLPSTYRASGAIILVRQGQPPGADPELAEAVVAAQNLLRSRAVADSAVANLKLGGSPEELLDDVEVSAEPDTSLVRFSVDADDGEQARRIGQELAEVFTVLYNGRFGPTTTASVWEAPKAQAGRVSPRPGLNLGIGAGLGLLAGAGLALRRRRVSAPQSPEAIEVTVVPDVPAPALPPARPQAPDPRLQERVAAVTARELALARRAAQLALRERELETLPTASPPLAPPPLDDPVAEPVADTVADTVANTVADTVADTVAETSNETDAAAMFVLDKPFVRPGSGSWTIGAVERLLAQEGPAFSDRIEELGFYLDSFRDVAGPGGELPAGVEIVVEDVFADLIERAGSAPP